MSRLQDKVALITGGANGLGEAIAQRMAEQGCAVLIVDRDEKHGGEVAKKLQAAGHKAAFHACDVTSEAQVLEFEEQLQQMELLVNLKKVADPLLGYAETALHFGLALLALSQAPRRS